MPTVAIVGRPNVGKSTFFNKISGKRLAIVQDEPGVTRDRIYAQAEWRGFNFTMIDTGGIDLKSDDAVVKSIFKQASEAIETADIILMIVDGKEGLMPADHDAAAVLRASKKPVILAVNKLDNFDTSGIYEFYKLGLGEPFPFSAEQGLNTGDLLDVIVSHFPQTAAEEDKGIKIAVVGKPNAGKSSLVNRLLGKERVIVSDIAGTTRDAIDTPFQYGGKDYVIIDTAGIRRKRSIEDASVESYSVLRAFEAVRRADVAVLILDAGQEISEQDARIAGYIDEWGKPSVVVINKWDLIEKDTFTIEKFNEKLKTEFAFMSYFKSVTISAKTGQRVDRLMSLVEEAFQNSNRRIATGMLNDIINDAIATTEPPSYKGRKLKINYSAQTGVCPPAFTLKVNDAKLIHFSYLRYLENSIRAAADFSGTPIKITAKNNE